MANQQNFESKKSEYKYVWIVCLVGFFLFVLLFLRFGGTILEKISPSKAPYGRTTNMTPIELKLVDKKTNQTLRMRIPMAYLTDTRNWSGGTQRLIEIQTGLPDMKPRPSLLNPKGQPGTPEYEQSLKIFRDGVFIHFGPRTLRENYQDIQYLNFFKYRKVRREPDIYGLEHYMEQRCREIERLPDGTTKKIEKTCRDSGTEWFISPASTEKGWVMYRCSNGETGDGERSGCQGRATYRDWQLVYIFRRSEIARWQEFDTAVRKLLDSFVIQ